MIFLLEEKTCRAEMFCTEQQHSMAEAGGEKFPLVFAFVGEYTQKLHDSLKEGQSQTVCAGTIWSDRMGCGLFTVVCHGIAGA